MLNQVAVEALYSATYVENYLDSVENLPDDVQKYLSRIREIDVQFRAHLRDSDYYYEQWSNCSTSELESANAKRSRAMARIQQSFIASQELGDEKLQIVTQLQELIDQKTRQLEHDFKNLDYGKDDPINDTVVKEPCRIPSPTMNLSISGLTTAQQMFVASPVAASISGSSSTAIRESFSGSNSNGERASKRARRTRADTLVGAADTSVSDNNLSTSDAVPAKQSSSTAQNAGAVQKKGAGQAGKKKKRKARGTQGGNNQTRDRDDTPPPEEPIDPDEPTYCLCDQISFGEMILCDNDLCPIEWFHFSCVSLMSKPKGKWYCPNCRGDRPNVMKPKAQFLKELERYNKEKEEKT
ncbi:inhibitor of growth protein 5 [Phlebotomus argentipes]|uniref:inhibitor of growth protein 5 n=1 Tax=Phlebotomus argentipes TaxID=94469 RepID=UPI002892D0F1|nr:inhibitor of growth protein 5 [Phlebotomus argentipes]